LTGKAIASRVGATVDERSGSRGDVAGEDDHRDRVELLEYRSLEGEDLRRRNSDVGSVELIQPGPAFRRALEDLN
jgi:hypothetical protein